MKLLPAILVGALLAGILDLAYAYTHFMVMLRREPLGIVQGIASGLIGGKAASGAASPRRRWGSAWNSCSR
jgi:hypothetical protein